MKHIIIAILSLCSYIHVNALPLNTSNPDNEDPADYVPIIVTQKPLNKVHLHKIDMILNHVRDEFHKINNNVLRLAIKYHRLCHYDYCEEDCFLSFQ